MPNITSRRPLRRTASATAPGKLPPPQMIASGGGTAFETSRPPPWRSRKVIFGFFATVALWAHQPQFSSFADEGDDFADARLVGELASDAFDPVGERTRAEKQLAIGST